MDERKNNKKLTKSGIIAITGPYRWMVIQAIFLFISAGHMNLFRAWIYFGVCIVGSTVGAIIMWKIIPELANQRGEMKQGTKSWDKVFLASYFPLILLIQPVIIGLDVGRFHWSKLPIHFVILGILLYIIGSIIILWAMIVNKHFEGTVRIQEDREHQVCTSGPYKIVRHPGYMSMILVGFCFPLILGSLWGLVPAGIGIILVVIRTVLEDKTLQRELDGYTEYVKKVKYRLFPWIW